MDGPHDPQHPGQDAGAPQAEAQDDLHALLERLLGQGDVGPSAPGAGDDLWPDLFAAPAADEASTIVPAPDAPAAVAEPTDAEVTPAIADVPSEARAWEPVVVDASATTNVDDIHAAILASVSVELQPVAPAAVDDLIEPVVSPAVADAPEADLAALDDEPAEAVVPSLAAPEGETIAAEISPWETADLSALAETAEQADEGEDAAAAWYALIEAESPEPDEPSFELTPFVAPAPDALAEGDGESDTPAAAAAERDLEAAPLLDLEVAEPESVSEPLELTGVVLPWPSQEPKAEPAPTAHDLIEAALAGLHHDLTSEPVEPLRTPDVAASTAHVVFRLGSRRMAIPLSAVSEIARPPKVTRLPHVPAWVLGIANLRGDIVSMLDLEGFFSGQAGKASHEQRMLALRPAGDEVRTAVLVDSVDGIHAFEDARIARVTRGYDAEVAPYARGLYQLEDDLVVVIDADRLLQSKPMRQFEDGAGAR
jgi:chemotaxis signal transduction protein